VSFNSVYPVKDIHDPLTERATGVRNVNQAGKAPGLAHQTRKASPQIRRIMKAEFVRQYTHGWKLFERLVRDFDQDAWMHTGRGAVTPVRMSFHILQSVKYHIEDSTAILFASGRSFECNWETANEEDLPTQNDVLGCIHELKARTEDWLTKIDFTEKNTLFEWAGETRLDVALFLLHHSFYHLGELSSLLNESKNGAVEDHYVKAL